VFRKSQAAKGSRTTAIVVSGSLLADRHLSINLALRRGRSLILSSYPSLLSFLFRPSLSVGLSPLNAPHWSDAVSLYNDKSRDFPEPNRGNHTHARCDFIPLFVGPFL
jgi:hypothetical protein